MRDGTHAAVVMLLAEAVQGVRDERCAGVVKWIHRKRWELKTGGVWGQAGIVPEFSTKTEESQLAIL